MSKPRPKKIKPHDIPACKKGCGCSGCSEGNCCGHRIRTEDIPDDTPSLQDSGIELGSYET